MKNNKTTLKTVTFLQRAHLFKKESESVIEALASPNGDVSKEFVQCVKDTLEKGTVRDRVAIAQYINTIINGDQKIEKLMIYVCGGNLIKNLLHR